MTQQTISQTEETSAKNWQQGFAAEIQRSQGSRGLRISSAGRCVRRQTYAATQTPPSDENDERSEARLALGHALEVLIVLNLKKSDWETEHTVLDGGQMQLSLDEMSFVNGHPDGKCRHPRHTNNMWVTLECKSMGSNRADLVFADGIFVHYEEYRSQIALYGRQLYRMGEVDHPERGVFATMDREGKPMAPERVSWEPAHFDAALERLQTAHAHADAGTLPERPFQPDDENCVFCPFRTLCWELEPDAPVQPGAIWKNQGTVSLNNTRVATRVEQYATAMQDRREVTKVLEEQCRLYGDSTIEIGGLMAGYFYPQDSVSYDESKLAKHMTAEQLRECRTGPPERRFWIRPASNRR